MTRARASSPIPAGDLWTKVTLLQPALGTPDKYGERLLDYTPIGRVWADVEGITGREVWYGQKVNAENTWGVTIRIWDGGQRPRLTSDWRVSWDSFGLILEIESIVLDLVRFVNRLQCKEVVVAEE